MRFSLLDPETQSVLVFPIAPQSIEIEMNSKVITVSPINLGDMDIQRGRQPIRFTWTGLLPGTSRRLPGVDLSLSPSDIEQQIRKWINSATGKQLRLVITKTKWNIPVRINSFVSTHSGGNGDINYTISLTEWRDLVVQESTKALTATLKTTQRSSSKPKQKTYTVKAGDSMWKIAQKLVGNGSRWPEMWAINKSRSRSKNPDLIYPGEVFLVPSGW